MQTNWTIQAVGESRGKYDKIKWTKYLSQTMSRFKKMYECEWNKGCSCKDQDVRHSTLFAYPCGVMISKLIKYTILKQRYAPSTYSHLGLFSSEIDFSLYNCTIEIIICVTPSLLLHCWINRYLNVG